MSFGAFTAYNYYTMSEEERFLLENIEALTNDEEHGGGYNERCVSAMQTLMLHIQIVKLRNN